MLSRRVYISQANDFNLFIVHAIIKSRKVFAFYYYTIT